MHSIWSGNLSFGLIVIPVKVYSGTAGTKVDLNMLHKTDLSPIRYAKVCRKDGKELTQDDIVKGYEYKDGDYVVLTNEDLKKLNAERSQVIDVVGFVEEEEIDPIYFEKPYFLEPGKGAEKAYFVLRESLKKSKKVGVVKFVMHTREHIGIVRPYNDMLIMEQIRYDDEIASWKELHVPEHSSIKSKELMVATSFITHLTEHFNPKDYKDNFNTKLKALIKQKLKGKPIKVTKERHVTPTKSGDLMAMLQESLEKAKKDPRVFQAQ
jgi:DNA end-binding protein Ku